jgi:ATP-dependent Clp protease ATP-binding subunit ClpC
VLDLFENYTERGKDAVLLSIEEASRLGHDCVGTEHLVLGLIRVEAGMARHILVGKGLDLESLRAEVRRIVGTGEGSPEVQPPLSKQLLKTLDLARREMLSLEHEFINTEHLLLGLTRNKESVGARMLLNLADLTYTGTCQIVVTLLMNESGQRKQAKDPAAGLEVRWIVDGKLNTVLADAGSTVIVVAPEGSIPCSTPREYEGRKGLAVWHTPARAEA